MSYKPGSLSMLTMLLATTAIAPPTIALIGIPAIAQSTSDVKPEFPLLKTVPQGTTVRLNGSSSMMKINQALEQKFQAQYPGTSVKTSYDGTDAGLKAVLEGKADLAPIGRALTDAEKAKDLNATAVSRNKIAIIVGKDNPFAKSLTINQFAQVFRGQINDWSKLGGTAGKIRLIDRPDSSDTRNAFANYPVFKNAPFKTGTNTVKLSADTTDAVIKALGKDGIGYAIADQVIDNPNVRVLAMHQVLPTDQRYPFSQPLMYAYQGKQPNNVAQAFLGYATANENQSVVEQARVSQATANISNNTQAATATISPAPTQPQPATATVSPAPTQPQTATATVNPAPTQPEATGATNPDNNVTSVEPGNPASVANAPAGVATAEDSKFPWWLLLIPVLGGMLWWLLKNINGAAPAAVAPVAAAAVAGAKKKRDSRIILTPRDARHGYAYWEIPDDVEADLRRQGKRGMKLRLYDVTDIDLDLQNPHTLQEFNCHERDRDLHLPIPLENREYIAEIGYKDNEGNWLQVARSQPVRFSDQTVNLELSTNTGLSADEQAEAAALWDNVPPQSQPLTNRVELDSLQTSDAQISDTQTSDTLTNSVDTNANIDSSPSSLVDNSSSNWQTGIAGAAAAGAAAVGGASLFNLFGKNRQSQPDTASKTGKLDSPQSKPQVIMVPRTPDSAYTYWEIPANHQTVNSTLNLEEQKLVLRLYDTTGVDNFNTETAQPFASYDCTGQNDLHVRIPEAERDYMGELGYETTDGNWLKIAQTQPVHVPAEIPTSPADNHPNYPTENPEDNTRSPIHNLSTNPFSVNSPTSPNTSESPRNGGWRPVEAAKTAVGNVVTDIRSKTNNGFGVVNRDVGNDPQTLPENPPENPTETSNQPSPGWISGVKKTMGGAFAGGAAAVAGLGTATNTFFNPSQDQQTTNLTTTPTPPKNRKTCQIILVPRNSTTAYAYWEVSDEHKQAARNQGGRKFMLRVHDSTNLDIDYQQPHLTQEYTCDEQEFDKHIVIPTSDRDYIAEVGYYTEDNRWIRIIRSFHIHI